MMKTCIDKKLYKLTLEKMVIGVEEPVLVKGIGELIAKVDSGNSGYNVIHGEDIVIQGDIINFKTVNKDGDERRVSKKIKDTIKINIGGGHIQNRYVIELDVQFGGEDYKKVPFSITNRSDNEHKILISKDFVGKELEALIDVTKDNISNDDINVDYVTEGAWNMLKKANNFVGKMADKADAFNKYMGGEYQQLNTYDNYKVPENIKDEVKSLDNIENLQKTDAELIRNNISKQGDKLKELNVSTEANDIAVFKILDYTGGTNKEGVNGDPEFKERMQLALKQLKKLGQKEAKQQNITKRNGGDFEERLHEEAEKSQDNQQLETSPPIQSAAQNDNSATNTDNKLQSYETEADVTEITKEEIEELFYKLDARNKTIFYIINFKKDIPGNILEIGEKVTESIQKTIDAWNTKIIQGNDWSYNAFGNAAKDISQKIQNIKARGLFALCSGPLKKRKVEFYTNALFPTNLNAIEFIEEYNQLNAEYQEFGGEGNISEKGINLLLQEGEQPQDEMSTFIEEYNNLNNEYLKIADDMAQSGNSINEQDIQTLIELAQESAQNKQSEELAQANQ